MTTTTTTTTNNIKAQEVVNDILKVSPNISFDSDTEQFTASWVHYGYPVRAIGNFIVIEGLRYLMLDDDVSLYVDEECNEDGEFDDVETEMENRRDDFMKLLGDCYNYHQ